jgi:hypothetical protein
MEWWSCLNWVEASEKCSRVQGRDDRKRFEGTKRKKGNYTLKNEELQAMPCGSFCMLEQASLLLHFHEQALAVIIEL